MKFILGFLILSFSISAFSEQSLTSVEENYDCTDEKNKRNYLRISVVKESLSNENLENEGVKLTVTVDDSQIYILDNEVHKDDEYKNQSNFSFSLFDKYFLLLVNYDIGFFQKSIFSNDSGEFEVSTSIKGKDKIVTNYKCILK